MTARGGFALAALLLAAPLAAAPARAADSCVECHSMQDDPALARPVAAYAADIHAKRGFGCAACHGGDPTDLDLTSMDPAKGFRGKLTGGRIAEMCASCHASADFMRRYNPRPYIFSIAEYRTSVHAKREAMGDTKVATCTNCHGVHGILPHTDPNSPIYARNVPATCARCHNAEYMKGRKIPTDQHEQYVKSVHGRALLERGDASAPACNDCHGNHGAAPPGVKGVHLVCGTCHGREAELFGKSPMRIAMERQGKFGCVVCHGNHGIQHPTDAMLAAAKPGVCGNCHEPGGKGEKSAAEIIGGYDALKADVARADSALRGAQVLGMETTHGREVLREAEDRLVGSRAVLHSFDAKQVTAVIAEGRQLASRANGFAESALRDWRTRRVGLAWSLVAIAFLILLLVLKIRSFERAP